MDICRQSNVSAFEYTIWVGHNFSSKEQASFNFMAAVTIWSDFQFSCSVVSNSLRPYGLKDARLPCSSHTPGTCGNSCPSSRWCHPTISSSVIPFSSCFQSFPAWGSFLVSQLFTSGSQSIGVSASASVLPMNIKDWFPLRLPGLISLQSKGLSSILSNTTVQKHQPSSQSIHDHRKNHSLD